MSGTTKLLIATIGLVGAWCVVLVSLFACFMLVHAPTPKILLASAVIVWLAIAGLCIYLARTEAR